MKQILVMMAAVVLVGCGAERIANLNARADRTSNTIIEKVIREKLKKPAGILTEADLAKVTSLDLGRTEITDAGLKHVAKLPNLTKLYLYNTKITDEGLKEVAKLQNLTYLNLSGTKITKTGAYELEKALPNCTVVRP